MEYVVGFAILVLLWVLFRTLAARSKPTRVSDWAVETEPQRDQQEKREHEKPRRNPSSPGKTPQSKQATERPATKPVKAVTQGGAAASTAPAHRPYQLVVPVSERVSEGRGTDGASSTEPKHEQARPIQYTPKGPVQLDLKNLRIHSLRIHDTVDGYERFFGKPEYQTEEQWMYPSRGIAFTSYDDDRSIGSVYFWLSKLGADEPFPNHEDRFLPCRLDIIKIDGTVFTPDANTSMDDVIAALGKPNQDEDDPDEQEPTLEYEFSLDEERGTFIFFEFGEPHQLKGVSLLPW